VVLVVLANGRPGYVQVGALLALVAVPGVIVQQLALSILAGLQRFRPFNLFRVAPNAGFAIAALALFLTGMAGFIELALAWGISRTIFAPFTLRSAWQHAMDAQTGRGEIPSTSWMLRFGRRAFVSTGTVVDTYRVDQAVVALFLPSVALGLYVVSLALTNLPRFVTRSVGAVATPTVASKRTRNQARHTMWRFFWIAALLYVPVIVGLWLLAPQLTELFFGEEFADSAPITRLLLAGTLLYCARLALTDASRGAGYPGLGSVAEIVSLVSVLPLFAVFVPLWELRGVAYALIGSSAIAMCVLVGGLLRPSARYATRGAEWFETPDGTHPPAYPAEAAQATGEPASHSA
jgi:O-antigen/teichoic acid export membrane protein